MKTYSLRTTITSVIILFCIILPNSATSQVSFIAHEIASFVSNTELEFIPVDMDNDDDLDLIIVSFNKIYFYKNESESGFVPYSMPPNINPNNFNMTVEVADVDLDGDMDIVVGTLYNAGSTLGSFNVIWLEYDGDKSFEVRPIIPSENYGSIYVSSVADIDLDGDMDLLVTDRYSDPASGRLKEDIVWYINDGQYDFTEKIIAAQKLGSPTRVSVVDFDNDGQKDFVAEIYLKYGTSRIAWYEMDNSGEEIQFIEHKFGGAVLNKNVHHLTLVDYEQDGDIDMLITNENVDTGILQASWSLNDGSANFNTFVFASDVKENIYAADMNSDGNMDVVNSDFRNEGFVWFENEGGGDFLKHDLYGEGIIGENFYPVDFDGDEDIDLLYWKYDYPTRTLNWYENINSVELPAEGEVLRDAFALNQNYPNPFNYETVISYQLQKRSPVSLKIHNQLGQLVNSVIGENQPAGGHQITWNGTDQVGNKLASGIYIYRLTTNEFTETRKMILIR